MSTIFPGNYVTHLNAYRGQGVFALPGIEFYQVRGAAVVTENQAGGGTLALSILSPDLRQDDKPRQDKPFVIPAGAIVYRSAISTTNLTAGAAETVAVDGVATAAAKASLAADADGAFDPEGVGSTFTLDSSFTAEATDVTVEVDYSGTLTIEDAGDQAAVLVEVCYYVSDGGPSTDEINLPYKTEAGQGY